MITYKKLIGEGITDSNGEASYNYVGVGAGKIDFSAESGILSSETYSLIDSLFYQEGTSEPPTNTWVVNGFTPSYSSDGTTLTSTTFATCFANLKDTGVNPFDFNSPFAVEIDIVSFNSSNLDFQLYDNTNNATRSASALGITGGNHLKIVNDGTSVKYYVDGIEKPSLQYNYAMGTCRVGLRATGTVTFKNFMIYPI